MRSLKNDKSNQSDDDEIHLIVSNPQSEDKFLKKLEEGISKVEKQLHIPIQTDSEDHNLDLFDRILRIGSNVKSLHQLISNLINDILCRDKNDTKFIQEILYSIKEKIQDSVNIPTESIQKIHKIAYCYVEEPEKLQKALQQSVMIHQDSETKIKFLQGRIMDLEQQVNFFIENQNAIPGNERIEEESRIKENDELKKENANLKKKCKELAIKYKKIFDQNSSENLSIQIKQLQGQIDNNKLTIDGQNTELTEIKSKLTKTETDLCKFKKAYVAIKKRYDAVLESTKEKESSPQKNNDSKVDIKPNES